MNCTFKPIGDRQVCIYCGRIVRTTKRQIVAACKQKGSHRVPIMPGREIANRVSLPIRSQQEQDGLLAICHGCKHHSDERCEIMTGCRESQKDNFRHAIRRGRCPIGKWEKRLRWVRASDRLMAIQKLASLVPSRVDAIAGISRSGVLPAFHLAELLHLPAYVMNPKDGSICDPSHGWRLTGRFDSTGTLLIVDDTVASGYSLKKLAPHLSSLNRSYQIAVVYCDPRHAQMVDFCAELLHAPHYLEWNFFNSIHTECVGLDFDGVLTVDGTTVPQYLPRKHIIDFVATGRHERYRKSSERWLEQHGVKVNRLIMFDGRQDDTEGIARFKAFHYALSEAKLYVESCPQQSRIIAACADKRVICPTSAEVLG